MRLDKLTTADILIRDDGTFRVPCVDMGRDGTSKVREALMKRRAYLTKVQEQAMAHAEAIQRIREEKALEERRKKH